MENLPAKDANGNEIVYTWTEQEVLGYTRSETKVGNVTIFTNTYRQPAAPPDDRPVPGKSDPGRRLFMIDDYDTPLGIDVMINHVGDCFE